MQATCLSCNRPLTLARSVQRGLGDICAAKAYRDLESDGASGDKVDIDFDPDTKDIICRRDTDGTKHFNIFHVISYHSPSGFEWGYPGSGPSDYALNILELFCREFQKPQYRKGHGQKITWCTQNWYMAFKDKFVAALPREGGVIKGDDIRTWLASKSSLAAQHYGIERPEQNDGFKMAA